MQTREARELGVRIGALVEAGQVRKAYTLLAPILAARTPFPILECIGAVIDAGSLEAVNAFLDHVAAAKTMGGWVVIGGALRAQLDRDLAKPFARCREYIVAADVWYATDILGERVPGPALLIDLRAALALLALWRADTNRWVRRTVGVAIHFWAKRAHGDPKYAHQVKTLLKFLEPMFEEREVDAIKGVGWGLKTLGKHYPDLVTDWLARQVSRPHRALMLRKATTYLAKDEG